MAISTVTATINNQTYTLTKNVTTGKYEATITAPSVSSYNNNAGHYYPVSISATDIAGNVSTINDTHATFGNNLKLSVKEKVAPTITITSPTLNSTGTNNTPTITAQLRDNDSGINHSSLVFKIDGGAAIAYNAAGMTLTPVSGGYDLSYAMQSVLSDGTHSVSITIADNDGNISTEATTTFKIDTVPPTLSVSSPVQNLVTNVASLNVIGVTNDVTSSPVTVVITLNATSQGSVTIDAGGNFSKAVTLSEGANTLVIRSTDGAGRYTEISRNVTLDTVAPVFSSVLVTPNPVDAGQTYIITIEASD